MNISIHRDIVIFSKNISYFERISKNKRLQNNMSRVYRVAETENVVVDYM